ncbi:MAG: glucose-6-phosphate dehydrogenase [Planctomycetota bacterium]
MNFQSGIQQVVQTPGPTTLVVFGASGDLTARKLMPALYNLALDGLIAADTKIVGFARRPKTDASFRDEMKDALAKFSRRPLQDAVWQKLAANIAYHQSDFNEAEGFARLREKHLPHGRSRIFYFATPPTAYTGLIEQIKAHHLSPPDTDKTYARIVIEKPVGHDYKSAEEINAAVAEAFHERQVFRIDHYLGKETVQNLLLFRFANNLFEPLWNSKYIDNVQITVSESIGVGSRGDYYDTTGVLRDMIQNHVLQLLCLITMEPPSSLSADAIRNEKIKVLSSLRPIDDISKNVVRGQYGPGYVESEKAIAYRSESRVNPQSITDTFVAIRAHVDNFRWSGVPFYVRSGKRLPQRVSEIVITFKELPRILYNMTGGGADPNILRFRIQPQEGISLSINAKGPHTDTPRVAKLDFDFDSEFAGGSPEAYERLLLDVMLGNQTLFMRRDEVASAWQFITGIHEQWARNAPPHFPNYASGTWGPDAAAALLAVDGRHWHNPVG